MFEVGWSRSCRDESQELQSEKTWNEEYRKNRITEIRDNGNTRITEIKVGYLSKPEGTVDMGTKWAIKRDRVNLYPLIPHLPPWTLLILYIKILYHVLLWCERENVLKEMPVRTVISQKILFCAGNPFSMIWKAVHLIRDYILMSYQKRLLLI